MSVTAYVHWEDPNGHRAQAAEVINSDSECQLEVIPVDSGFGLEYGEVLYQGDGSRMLVYEYRDDAQKVLTRAGDFKAFPVWKGDPEVSAWLEAQGVTVNVNHL